MIHLSDMTLVQMLLIEVGVILQLIAVGAYLKGSSRHYHRAHDGAEGSDAQDNMRDFQTGGHSQAIRSGAVRHDSHDETVHHHEFRGGRLTRTAKVGGFVQSFKFRE
jgi:hypothetical protein